MSTEFAPQDWTCQIMLTGPAPTEAARNEVALKWLEIVLESGGTLSPRPYGSSVACWRASEIAEGKSPPALTAAWAMGQVVARVNDELRAEGKPDLRLTLLLHGSELCDAVEAPIHARRLHLKTGRAPMIWVTEASAKRAGNGFVLVRKELASPATGEEQTFFQVLSPRRAPTPRVDVAFEPVRVPVTAESACFPKPLPQPERAPIVILGTFELEPAAGSSERSREFTLFRTG